MSTDSRSRWASRSYDATPMTCLMVSGCSRTRSMRWATSGTWDGPAAPDVLPERRPVGAGQRLVGQLRRPYDRPIQVAVANDVFHHREIGIVLAERHSCDVTEQVPHEEPVPRVVPRRPGSAGRGHGPDGRGADDHDASYAPCLLAPTMARVPLEAIPASAFDRGPRPESTASAPPTADSSASWSGAARSAVTMRTLAPDSFVGSRTTAVTSCPAARACSRASRPMPPVAAKIVSFISSSDGHRWAPGDSNPEPAD